MNLPPYARCQLKNPKLQSFARRHLLAALHYQQQGVVKDIFEVQQGQSEKATNSSEWTTAIYVCLHHLLSSTSKAPGNFRAKCTHFFYSPNKQRLTTITLIGNYRLASISIYTFTMERVGLRIKTSIIMQGPEKQPIKKSFLCLFMGEIYRLASKVYSHLVI